MANNNQTNLFKAFGLFIEAFRPYVVSLLIQEVGDKWPARFYESLGFEQKNTWNIGLKNGSTPETLIDYHHLKSFAIKNKDLFKSDFGKKFGDVPNWLGEIAQVRHDVAHFNTIDEDEATKAWIHMKTIAKLIGMSELEDELIKIQKTDGVIEKVIEHEVATPVQTYKTNSLKPWFQVTQPHFDIKQGRLDESVFAANLAEVALGNGREIYKDPSTFFSKTYFTAGLKSVTKTVIKGLNGNEDAENRVISLQTGFGGGKTHTLISIYHLCNWGKKSADSALTAELLAYTGVPEFDKANIAVFTNTTNDPTQGRQVDGITIKTIWGELAYQLGGLKAYSIIKENDEKLSCPKGLFPKVLEQCKPALILIDELTDYCVSAAAIMVGQSSLADQTISFMQELTEAVASTNNCVAIITLPASVQEVANSDKAASILSTLQNRVVRIGADTQPVAEDEIYEVIRRRLFEDIGDKAYIEYVASQYASLYEQHWTELPSNVSKSEYKQKIIKAYPFHPELVDIFKIRWASHNNFQRTRGVLRLLAAIVSDLWKRQQSLPGNNVLIHSGDIYLPNLDTVTSQLKKLYSNGYESVISADIAGASANAFKIDNNKAEYGKYNLAQSIATVILLNSFGSEGANKGLSIPELKLQLLAPNSFNHNSINGALSDLENSAYYLYYAQTGSAGKRYWFHVKPNISMLINQGKQDVDPEDISAEILKRLKEKTNNRINMFKVLVDPAIDIPEQIQPTLVILHPDKSASNDSISTNAKKLIEKIATKKGNSERIYRNTILFLLASDSASGKLQTDIRDYLACQKIATDYNSTLELDQKNDLIKRINEANKNTDKSLVTTYSTVCKYSVKNGLSSIHIKEFKESIDNQLNTNIIDVLKEEEWILEMVGLNLLKTNNLLPTPLNSIKTRDVYEAFLRFDDKPMITGIEAVSKSLQRYCFNGEFCIATGDGTTFSKYFIEENVPFFDVNDIVYWLVDKSLKPQPQVVTPPAYSPTGEPVSQGSTVAEPAPSTQTVSETPVEIETKKFKSITVSGNVPLERYTELFNYFITPFAMNGNKIEIEVSFKIKSNSGSPIDESKQQYKSAKEAAKQLGLDFEEEL